MPDLVGNYTIQLTYPGQFFASRNVTYSAAQSPTIALSVQSEAGPRTWTVDDDLQADFHTIQEAISAASSGDTIIVRAGNYTGNVVVYKTLSLYGAPLPAGGRRPIIVGNKTVAVVKITADNVLMNGFEVVNGGYGDSYGDGMLGGGIELFGVNNCIIMNNSVRDNLACGISLVNSNNNTIANNTCVRNWIGIRLWAWSSKTTNHNTIQNNTCSQNQRNGINLWSYTYMTWVVNYNNITDNLISSNGFLAQYSGIDIGKSIGDCVTGNTITSNYQGIQLDSVFNCTFFHNRFINNTIQAGLFDEEGASINTWDSGYPSGGNSWSDYNGTDANHDGIGDTPYRINSNNIDRYPLMTTLDVKPANKTDNSSITNSSTLVFEKTPESQHAADETGNTTSPVVHEKPLPEETKESGPTPVDTQQSSDPAPNLLTVLVVAGVLIAPIVFAVYCRKMLHDEQPSKPHDVANG
jgi:parallel beta-helix repeat protein